MEKNAENKQINIVNLARASTKPNYYNILLICFHLACIVNNWNDRRCVNKFIRGVQRARMIVFPNVVRGVGIYEKEEPKKTLWELWKNIPSLELIFVPDEVDLLFLSSYHLDHHCCAIWSELNGMRICCFRLTDRVSSIQLTIIIRFKITE